MAVVVVVVVVVLPRRVCVEPPVTARADTRAPRGVRCYVWASAGQHPRLGEISGTPVGAKNPGGIAGLEHSVVRT